MSGLKWALPAVALLALLALFALQLSRPTSASSPPSAMMTPPSQIQVTKGFHQTMTCQRPSSPSSPTIA